MAEHGGVKRQPCAYRVLGTRLCGCGCGTTFAYTTQYRKRKYLDHEHANRSRAEATAEMRARVIPKQRAAKFGRMIQEMLGEDRKVTTAQLLRLCAACYRFGHHASTSTRSHVRCRQRKQAA